MTLVATAYEIHPLAHLLPEMRPAEYEELREDIAANGLREAITLHDGQVLDGRHRYRACAELGLTPMFTRYDGDAPAAYVLSLNVKRRQLTPSQKAMLATDFLPHLSAEAHARQVEAGRQFGRGLDSSVSKDRELSVGPSARVAAQQVGVGEAQVNRASRVKREDPELAERVRNGEVTVGAALTQVNERERLAERTAALRGESRKPAAPSLATEAGQVRANAHKRRTIDLISSLTGFARGLESGIDPDLVRGVMEQEEIDEWVKQLGDSLAKFRQFRTQLQKGRNQS